MRDCYIQPIRRTACKLTEEFGDVIDEARLSAVTGKCLQSCARFASLNEFPPFDANLSQ